MMERWQTSVTLTVRYRGKNTHKKTQNIDKTSSRMRGPLAKSTTASGAMMGMWSRVAPCPSMPCVCSDTLAMWEIVFKKKSFILHLPAKKRTDFRTPCADQTCSWIYLAVFLLGGGFNERPSPAVTPRLALKRAVPACFNRPTPPSMFCAVKAFQRKGGKKTTCKLLFFIFNSKASPAAN